MSKSAAQSIWLELQIDPRDPQLLTILDQLLISDMLNAKQILEIAQTCLSEKLPLKPVVTIPLPVAVEPEPKTISNIVVPTIWQTLKDELSVRWLLFLGVFLVVLSSGVLAATQWSRFPAGGQYGLLWLYTIGFWVAGRWASRQEGLGATANTLRVAALLLIPVNFWAIDSFDLWRQPWELATALVAGVSLLGMAYLSTQQRHRRSLATQWLMGTYLGLSFLQLGWQIPHWATIAIYLGSIGLAIVLQKNRQIEKGALAIYGLGMLLLRGLFVVKLPLVSFSLAIGILGWLFAQWGIQYQQKLQRVQSIALKNSRRRLARYQKTLTGLITLYHRLGAGLLLLGWLLGLSQWPLSPWQSVAVDGLALAWIWQRLQRSASDSSPEKPWKKDLVALFVVGLQTYFLSGFMGRFLSTDALLAKILPSIELLFGQNYLFAGGLLVFPYLLFWVWLTSWFWRRGQPSSCHTGENLIVGTGLLATCLTIATPLGLLLDLLVFTAILAHLTHRHAPVRTGYLYLTHFCGLLTILAVVAYRWDWCKSIIRSFVSFPDNLVVSNDVFLGLMVGSVTLIILTSIELWFSTRLAEPEHDDWQRSAWTFGWALAVLAYSSSFSMLLTFSGVGLTSPLWWLVIPTAFIYVATRRTQSALPWQLATQSLARWWAIGGLAEAVILTGQDAGWRSIMLAAAVGLMCPIIWSAGRQISSISVLPNDLSGASNLQLRSLKTSNITAIIFASIHLGFGWGLAINLLSRRFPNQLWPIILAVVVAGLWYISKKLRNKLSPFAVIYSVAADYWAIGLAAVGILFGAINYLNNDMHWLIMPIVSSIDPSNINLLQNAGIANSTNWLSNTNFSVLITTMILLWAIAHRQRWRDANSSPVPLKIWFWSMLITAQIGLGAAVHLVGGGTLALAVVNIGLAFVLWLGQVYLQQRSVYNANSRTVTGQIDSWSFAAWPVWLAAWGLILRLPFFDSYTGLLSIGIGIIGILSSRSFRPKWLAYGSLLLMTLGCYELVTYQILQAPTGGNIADALTIYGLVTTLLALIYRLIAWIQTQRGQNRCWDLPLLGLKNVAHAHWAVASIWKVAAAVLPPVPLPQLTLLHLFTSGLLGVYALIQGRDRERGDWWVYLGLVELMGVGVYARSIFQGLGVVDEGLILVACLVGLLVLLAPWSEWGWHNRPWQQVALILPLSRVIFEGNNISLLNLAILAIFYGGVARRQQQFGWAYLSLVFVNWAGMRLLVENNLTSPLWYSLLVGLSILVVVQWDPAWSSSRPNRHYGRLVATGLIAVTALVWHQNEPWLAISLGLVIGTAGLVWRVRAWLYVGTITFVLSNCYQLVVLINEQPMTKWAIGLLAGILIIALAANFERRREQINQALQHWLDHLQEWQ
jgi:hypothetical protein